MPIASLHAGAHHFFPADAVLVNKIAGTFLQVVGGLIVLYSVNANLGLFRQQHLGNIIFGWFRSFPLFRKTVMISPASSVTKTHAGTVRISVPRTTNTIEEKIAELERQLNEFRQNVNEDIRAVNLRIGEVHAELSNSVASNLTTLNQLSSRLEFATVGGFKQQAVGVLLALYGAITSLFA